MELRGRKEESVVRPSGRCGVLVFLLFILVDGVGVFVGVGVVAVSAVVMFMLKETYRDCRFYTT